MFALDASVVASWCFADESHPHAEAANRRIQNEGALAPALFWFELRNVLLMGERRRRITEAETARFLTSVGKLQVQVDREPDEANLFGLARTHKLSFYDAAYLEMAKRKGIDLATLVGQLIKAAKAEKVQLVGARD